MPDAPLAAPVGSGGHSVTELVVALASQPEIERLDLVTLEPGLAHPVTLRRGNVRVRVGPYRPRARARAKDLFARERRFIAESVRKWQPDAVSAHWTYEYALGALDAAAPTLITVRDWAPTILRYQFDKYRAVRLAMQAMCLARGRHFAAVSPYMASKVERVVRRPVAVLPNSLGPKWLDAPATDYTGHLVVAANNGFGRRKNVKVLLRAWRDVMACVPSAKLVLVGDGYEPGGPAARWAAEHLLGHGVEFRGAIDRHGLQGLLSKARLFVHPSREESFGLAVLEAMSLGVPVVGGNRSGAVPWLLGQGGGLTVDVRRPAPITRAIVRLLSDQTLAREIGSRARADARRRFAVDKIARSYVDNLKAVP